jgi:periplasmic protein TonB
MKMRNGGAPPTLQYRLIVAAATTVAFHAAVFGVVEWRLAVAAEATRDATASMAVTVRLDAYRPEPAPPAPSPAAQPAPSSDNAAETPHAAPVTPVRAVPPPAEALPDPVEETPATPRPLPQPVGATRTEETTRPTPRMPSPTDRAPGDAAPAAPTAAAPSSIPTYETVRYTPPSYPEAARRAGRTGTVELVLTLSRRGTVTEVTVHRSSSVPELDRAAVRAAGTWRFPRGEAGRRSIHRIRFDLEETR